MYNRMIIALIACGLTGCSTATPRTAGLYAPKVVVTGARPVSKTRAVVANSGVYPTFGPPITAASTQMNDLEAQRLQTQMSLMAGSQQRQAVSEAEYQARMSELRLLSTQHVIEMENRIAK